MSRLLVLGSLVVAALGCGDTSEESGGAQGLRRGSRAGAVAEEADVVDAEHDAEASEGETAADPGNPAADTRPAAPTSAGTAAPELALTLQSATPSVNLGEKVDVEVTIAPKAGFTGMVTLEVSGLSPGVTAKPVTTNIAGAVPTIAKITLEASVTATVTAKDASVPLVITAKAGAVQATANANFKVAPRLTIMIPKNVDALRAAGGGPLRAEYGAAFGPDGQALQTQGNNGIVVTVFNADSKAHIIHGPGGAFPHGNTGAPIQPNAYEMANGAPRTRTLQVGASVTAYPHDGANGQNASFRIRVAAAAN